MGWESEWTQCSARHAAARAIRQSSGAQAARLSWMVMRRAVRSVYRQIADVVQHFRDGALIPRAGHVFQLSRRWIQPPGHRTGFAFGALRVQRGRRSGHQT